MPFAQPSIADMDDESPRRTDSLQKPPSDSSAEEFSKMAEDRQPGFLSEFWGFLIQNKKWWLTPILVILFLLIVLVIISQTPLAPFVYPFF